MKWRLQTPFPLFLVQPLQPHTRASTSGTWQKQTIDSHRSDMPVAGSRPVVTGSAPGKGYSWQRWLCGAGDVKVKLRWCEAGICHRPPRESSVQLDELSSLCHAQRRLEWQIWAWNCKLIPSLCFQTSAHQTLQKWLPSQIQFVCWISDSVHD